jgi:hypothetical protein
MRHLKALLVIFGVMLSVSCGDQKANLEFERQGREVPVFDSENAYNFIDDQVSFGPRVPNSEAHVQTKEYLKEELEKSAGARNVFVQEFQQTVYGDTLTMFNILAGFGLQYQDRIILAAHWDSRPRAEQDPDNPDMPILGADDGASGVGVLLELAQIFSEHDLPLGVDIIFFDGEDYGEVSDLDNYFLGARQWSNYPPVPGYNPRFGILLDMVGGQNAVFYKESYSMSYAPNLVNEIWSIADMKGYSDMFINQRGGAIADDHIVVQQQAGIEMINIIHHSVNESGTVQFAPYWHTQNDNMEIIDHTTLQAVGDVLLELIYNRIPQ